MPDVHIDPRITDAGHKRWRLRFRLANGDERSRTFTSGPLAEKWLKVFEAVGCDRGLEMLDRERDGEAALNAPAPMTVSQAVERHVESLTRATDGTRASYRREAARDITPHLGAIPVAALSRADVSRWINRLGQPWPDEVTKVHAEKCKRCIRLAGVERVCRRAETGIRGLSGKTIANRHGLLSAALSAAVREGDAPGNVARGIPLPESERRPPVFLAPVQIQQLLAALPERYRPLVLVMVGTGLRWGEVTALRVADLVIDDLQARIDITRAWKDVDSGAMVLGPPKTKRSRRTLTLRRPSPVVDDLTTAAKGRPGQALVFTSPRGDALRNGTFHTRVWIPTMDKLEAEGWTVRPRVHDLRHTAASLMLTAGEDIGAVSRVLGHEKISTTVDVYGHLVDGAREKALDALAGQLAAALTVS